MMDARRLAEIQACLEAERDRLEQEIADLERDSAVNLADASGEHNYRDHMADQATATFGKEFDLQLEGIARQQYEQVTKALERIAAGTYGTCLRCGGPIADDRLAAVPAASLCIECKEWEESR